MKPHWQVERALELSDAGRNNCQIAREFGLNRRTVSDWVRGRTRIRKPASAYHRPGFGGEPECPRCPGSSECIPGITVYAYAYLLGLSECQAAMSLVLPVNKVAVYRHRNENVNEVSAFSKHWPHLFPQHGPGVKHKRMIALEPWQQRIVERYPGRLLRGLIQSDGCRVTNRIKHAKKTYAYPRYFFSNRSLDIQRIFCDACDRLGIAWRQDGPWNVSVARRDAVAVMDRHVGPKR